MNKIHCKNCNSLQEFNKICRKYCKYFRNNYIYHTYWYIWLSYKALGKEAMEDKYLNNYANKLYKKGHKNLRYIIDEVLNNWDYSFTNKKGITYKLCGLEITNEDYYYLYQNIDNSKEIICNSCVGRITDIEHYG